MSIVFGIFFKSLKGENSALKRIFYLSVFIQTSLSEVVNTKICFSLRASIGSLKKSLRVLISFAIFGSESSESSLVLCFCIWGSKAKMNKLAYLGSYIVHQYLHNTLKWSGSSHLPPGRREYNTLLSRGLEQLCFEVEF